MSRRPDFQQPHLLRNQVEYETALHEVEELLETAPQRGSVEYERLEFLALLVEHYEEDAFPIEPPTSRAIAEFMLEQGNRSSFDRVLKKVKDRPPIPGDEL